MTEVCCETCIFWKPTKYIKAHGDCTCPLPFWVDTEYISWKKEGKACAMYREDQDEGN